MSDQEQKQESTNISPQPDAENKKKSTELSEEQLKKVSGGGPTVGDIPITKQSDKAS